MCPSVIPRSETSSPTRNASIDHHAAGIAELAIAEHRLHRRRRLRAGGADDGALARREAGCLHDQRLGMRRDVREGGREVGEGLARGRRNAGRGHDVLGERLRGLDARRGRTGAGDEPSLGAQAVGEAERQRYLGPDDDEVDAVHVGRIGDAIDVVGGDGEVGGEFSSTGVPGRAADDHVRVFAVEGPA